MSPLFFRIERNARLIMGGLALLTLVSLLLFKTRLIQFQPSFDAYGWYTVTTVDPGLTVTQETHNETTCRARSQVAGVTCLQGKSLNAEFFVATRAQ